MREAGEVGDLLDGYVAACDGDRRRGTFGAMSQGAREET